eukprot:CAMPEP_0175725640 /NCGR_PEP_ID=MMETSP0097-20121207/47863_1 /TAXON_ID=311494 /ORGANISM="Alexandrium monilatum, Strain CCMP3105" /LENGTH=395 /DNA_ID=CAMNT_0017033419 /DNA_START=37 /DNA_END=1221 /DNA_ORIENTATION=+
MAPGQCVAAVSGRGHGDAELIDHGPTAGQLGADALVKDLWENTEPESRRQAAAALGELGPAARIEGAHALVAAVVSDPEPSVRRAAARAIGLLRRAAGEASAGALATVLLKDDDAETRQRAAVSLGELGAGRVSEAGIQALVEAVCRDDSVGVREAASTALEGQGDLSVQPLLDSVASGASHQAVQRALSVLGLLASSEHADLIAHQPTAVFASFVHVQDDSVRAAVVDVFVALGARAGPSLPELIRIARNEEGDRRQLVAQAVALDALEALFQSRQALFHTPEGCRAASLLALHRSRSLAAPADAPDGRVPHTQGVRQAVSFLKRVPAARHRAALAHLEGPTLEGTSSANCTRTPDAVGDADIALFDESKGIFDKAAPILQVLGKASWESAAVG